MGEGNICAKRLKDKLLFQFTTLSPTNIFIFDMNVALSSQSSIQKI